MKNLLNQLNLENVDILSTDVYYPPWNHLNFTFVNPFYPFDKASTADIIFKQIFKHHRQSYNDYNPIFTDGSKSDDFVGCAYVIGTKTCSFSLHPALSIFSAEILAILKALEELSNLDKGNFIIYTDSMSVLQSFTTPNQHSHPVVFEVLNLLNHLGSRGFNIKFCWVPSHVGIEGNELADNAAKSTCNYLLVKLPYCDAKRFVTELVYKKWQHSWDEQTFNKLHEIKPRIALWPPHSSRKEDVILTRLRIGHTRYTHRHLLLRELSPTCNSCNVVMTVKHILIECPNFQNARLKHFNNISIVLSDLLSSTPHCNLSWFLKDIGFYPHI
jgi:ribonuclease HI